MLKLDETINYAAFFLTFKCNFTCPYCINDHNLDEKLRKFTDSMSGDEWVRAANRLQLRDDLPLTLQGGEPSLHKDFYQIVNEVKEDIKMDLLTNLSFDVDEFIANVPVSRFTRVAKYGPIRVSYHHGISDADELIRKTHKLEENGFRVSMYGLEHPDAKQNSEIKQVMQKCLDAGVDFRMKEFLGLHDGKLIGTFKYPEAIAAKEMRECTCRTTELLVGPAGHVYRCHSDVYNFREPIGHILDDSFTTDAIKEFRPCSYFGDCNPCDIKVKTNRFQEYGHISVEIKFNDLP